MELQYNFPLSKTPFMEVGERIGLSEDEVIEKVNFYLKNGVIVKIGAQLNYRSLNSDKAALVGVKVDKEKIKSTAKLINEMDGVKHNYLREHERYNVWFTIKSNSIKNIYRRVKKLVEKTDLKDYVVLPTKRVYKLDVKYDLFKGVSWSPPVTDPLNVPSLRQLRVDLNLIQDLECNFEPSREPFKLFSDKHGIEEGEIIDLIKLLRKLGAIRGFGAVLNPERIGFSENAMVMLRVKTGRVEELCVNLVRNYPEITHCVERVIDPAKWKYQTYFMVHAKRKDSIAGIVDEAEKLPSVLEVKPLFSLANLRGRI